MELQGAFEVVLNLRTCLELRLPDSLLLSLIVEKLREDHGLDDRPVPGPLGCPLVEHLLAGRCELSDLVGGACRNSGVDIPPPAPRFPAPPAPSPSQ